MGVVFFAVKEEAAPWLERRRRAGDLVRRMQSAGEGVIGWEVGMHRVWVTGMGGVRAVRAAQGALEGEVDWVLTCGFAGGLNPGMSVGTVIHEADPWFPMSVDWVGAGSVPGNFHCADRVAVTVGEKAALRTSTGADAVEMESGMIRELCRARGIPGGTVRVISDGADRDLPLDFNVLMTADHRMDYGRLAMTLVRSPGRVPDLMRFRRELTAAADRLAGVLEAVVPGMGHERSF